MHISIKKWSHHALLPLALLLTFSTKVVAAGTALVLVADPVLETRIATQLTTELVVLATDIETDPDKKAFITDEGTRIPFADLFHGRSLRHSADLDRLRAEYGTDYLVLGWIGKDEEEINSAYGLSKLSLTTMIRVIDLRTGKTVIDQSGSYEDDLVAEESKAQKAERRKAAIAAAADNLDFEEVLSAIANTNAGTQTLSQRVRVVFQNIDQTGYFEQRDALVDLMEQAGASSGVRDSYDEARQELTLRTEISSDLNTFYRSLYSTSVSSNVFDHFEISHDRKSITVNVLPPQQKRFVIEGITAENYHNRLQSYRAAIISQPGVKNLQFNYLNQDSGDKAQLVFSFTYGKDLTQLEEAVWNQLIKSGGTPNRQLISVTEQTILYRAGSVIGDRLELTLTIDNIAPGDYRRIGAPLDDIIKSLEVQNLKKEYDRLEYRLTYRFATTNTAVEIDTLLWGKIAADESLNGVVQDSTTDQNLGYFYFQQRPQTRNIVITVRTLSPDQYRTSGQSLIQIISAVEGVGQIQRSYSESDQTLTLRFRLRDENTYSIDSAIWDAATKDDALQHLSMGELDEDELEYFFSGPETSAQRDIVIHLKNVSGQDYKTVATQFADILAGIKHVRNVRYRYDLSKRTVMFRLQYQGDGLFELDDAVQRAMVDNELFEHVLKGAERLGRLNYIYSNQSLPDTSNEAKSTWAGDEYASADLNEDRLSKLDQTVVYLYVRTEEGDSEGTGFLISTSGYILTNEHVVAGGYVYVRTYDGSQYSAQVIKTDPELDLALLRIKTASPNFPKVEIGNSEQIRRGETITVIGHPLGAQYDYSVLTGIVSGYNRERGLLQLSIPSYKGVSGSPVFDSKGKVVGIMAQLAITAKDQLVTTAQKTAMVSVITTTENIGLAIPINYAKNIMALAIP